MISASSAVWPTSVDVVRLRLEEIFDGRDESPNVRVGLHSGVDDVGVSKLDDGTVHWGVEPVVLVGRVPSLFSCAARAGLTGIFG